MKLPAFVIPASLFAIAIVSRIVMTHAPASIATDLEQPIVVVTNWHAFGAGLCVILIAGVGTATIAYIAAIGATLRQARGATIATIVAVCVLSLGAAWLVPAIFSSDVYAYAAYGELARLGMNPYGHAHLAAGNPLLDAAIWQWSNPLPTCVYGPAFVALARGIVGAFSAFGMVAQLDALRVCASLALAACAVLAYAAYSGDRLQRLAAAATIGLNPVAIWCAAEGHNDAIALAVVLAGFALVRRGAWGAGAALATLSGLLKLPGAASAIVLAGNRRAATGALVGLAAVLAASYPLFDAVTHHLAPHGRYAPLASFQAIVFAPVTAIVRDAGAASIVTFAIALLAAGYLVYRGIGRLRNRRAEGWIWIAMALWLLVPNPYPWYGLWLIAVAAVAPRSREVIWAIALSLASLLRYVPDAVAAPSAPFAVALGIGASLPLLGLCCTIDTAERPS